MIQSLLGYTPHKAATRQNMTKWDHKVRLWMENIMATAYGVAPALALQLPEVQIPQQFVMRRNSKGKMVPRLDEQGLQIPNPEYDEQVMELGKAMAPIYEELVNRQAFARHAALGFNITFEMLRYARNLNFANEVIYSYFLIILQKKGGLFYVLLDSFALFLIIVP